MTDTVIERAALFLEARDVAGARRLLVGALQESPGRGDVLLLLAEVLEAEGADPAEREQCLRAAHADPASRAGAAGALASLLRDLPGRRPEALEFAREYVELQPDAPRSHLTLAEMLAATREMKQAKQSISTARELANGDPETLNAVTAAEAAIEALYGSKRKGVAILLGLRSQFVDSPEMDRAVLAAAVMRWRFVDAALQARDIALRAPMTPDIALYIRLFVAFIPGAIVGLILLSTLLITCILLPVLWATAGADVAARLCATAGLVTTLGASVIGILPLLRPGVLPQIRELAAGSSWRWRGITFTTMVTVPELLALATAQPGWIIVAGALSLIGAVIYLFGILELGLDDRSDDKPSASGG